MQMTTDDTPYPTDHHSVNSRRDHRDLVIETLADSEAELRERIASLEEDVAVYREMTNALLDALRQRLIDHDELRAAHERLTEEYRTFREGVLIAAGVAA